MPTPRTAARLLAVEGGLGAAWVVALIIRDDLGAVFLPPDVPAQSIRSFVVADTIFYVVLPILVAIGLARGATWARALLLLHGGGVTYALLWGLGLYATTGHGLVGVLLMAGPVGLCAWIALARGRGRA